MSTERDPAGERSPGAGSFARRSAVGFGAVVLTAIALAAAVQMTSGPVQRADQAVANDLNAVVAPHRWIVTTLQVLTAPGSSVTAWIVLGTLTAALMIRRKWHLAVYVAVTGLGAAVLSPLLKHLVDRLRPVVAMPVATAGGASFPSGHTLAVTVWVGVVLLVLLPLVPDRRRHLVVGIGVALVVVVGLTRIALGVHFVSDVVGGWLIGGGWLLATSTAFRAWRRRDGLPVADPGDGLAPEVADDLVPAPVEPAPPHPWTTVAQLLVVAVLLCGAVIGVGMLLVHLGPDSGLIRADVGVVAWLADHRTPWFDPVSAFLAELGNTQVIITGGAVAALLAYLATRRWRPSLVIAATLVGEVLIFLASSAVVGRPRPPVNHLDGVLPPTSSFPSGHTAAATCLYGAIAFLVLQGTRAWWRWVVLAAAVALVVAVGLARLYRGAHHPTDVLTSLAFAISWLLAVLNLIGEPRAAADRTATRTAAPVAVRS